MPKVTLLNKDQLLAFPLEEVLGEVARVSTDADTPSEKITKHCFDANHGTAQRAILFTFQVSEVSRAFSHQFVRHNIGIAHIQRSQRYVSEDGFSYVIPPTIAKNPHALTIYEEFMHTCDLIYQDLKDLDVPAEDVRYVLPNGTHTIINSTFTPQALIHFCHERLCNRAQWEIREVAKLMVQAVVEVSPFLAGYLVPKCAFFGYCPEVKGCGYFPSKKAVLSAYKNITN